MAKIRIDDVPYEVEAGQNLLHCALSAGIDLPYFCWHPALGSVGACRQCAVVQYRDEADTDGRLVMACMTPVAEGMRFSVETPDAREFRRAVVEWLMMSHPHDCPVCEEGGECHLQDMTVMTGHVHRAYRGHKRTWRNQYLGPFLNHEMNRCITCYRCVRFYRDYAGGTDLEDFGSRDRVYFGRQTDGVLENEFSGNLVEVCPTGVFTDKPFSRRYVRKWDLQSAPSVCPGCSVGCNTLLGARQDELRRVHNRYHPDVNGYFLCDRGRFGQAFVEAPGRLDRVGRRTPDGSFDEVDGDAAIREIGAAVRAALGRGRCAGIGSPRASLETNHLLARLVGAGNFCPGFAIDEDAAARAAVAAAIGSGARIPTLSEIEAADAILVVGEDPLDTAPRLALALRQAVLGKGLVAAAQADIPPWHDSGVRSHGRHERHPLFLATVLPSRSADLAAATLAAPPPDLAATARAIAERIAGGGDADAPAFVGGAAEALRAASRPLVIAGTALGDAELVHAAASVVEALRAAPGTRDVACLMIPREANAFGVGLLDGTDQQAGPDLGTVLDRAAAGSVDVLLIAENDLMRRAPPERVTAALDRVDQVVLIDVVESASAEAAHWLLPAASHAEAEGTLVSSEGRAQRYFPAFPPRGSRRESWRWLTAMARAAGRSELAFEHLDEVVRDCAARGGPLAGIVDAAPDARWRDAAGLRIARQSWRHSGRTAMHADRSIHEPQAPTDEETPLGWTMEGSPQRDVPAALTPHYWAPGWNSNQALTRFQQEVGGPLRGGEPGRRLLGDGACDQVRIRSGTGAPASGASASAPEGLRAFPVSRIFGSDELSARAPAVRERTGAPFAILAPGDAGAAGLQSGDGVRVYEDGASFGVYRVVVDPAAHAGWIGLALGLPGVPGTVPRGALRLVPTEAPADPADPTAGVIARG